MMVEVFTIGGGEYIVNTFNAVAAWTGGGGYRSLLRVVMVLGLIYALMAVAFTMNVRAWLNWFIGSGLIYGCLMVPTVNVKVTDRVNPSLAPAVVSNVPLGLGVIASFTSQVGDYLTRSAETVFTMPSQLRYSSNGMVYGSRLLDATRNFQIRDAEFATNLSSHFKNCVFGDIMLGQKSMTDLAAAKDLWQAIGPGSVARSQPWTTRTGALTETNIITCNNAYDLLSQDWVRMIAAHTPIWGKQTYPKLSTSVAAAKLRQDVPIANQAFTASSANYETVVRQNTAINAFMQARDGMAGGPASASIDTFATTRADIQARNTYNSIAQQAMSWVPILNIVLTVVFYAMFPVIFPLFLMPQTGVGALKGYLTGFFYLAAWGPLYVILHMICMSQATSAGNAAAEGGMSLGTYAGIGAINAETATIAGFMLMSVPFLAAGLAKGAMSISGQATSILSPAQNAAEAAAGEQTTGNYSYGNTSFANSTSNMRQSNQWSDASSYSTGAGGFSFRHDNGATTSTFGNGSAVIDTTGAMSRLGVQATLDTGYVAEMRQQASMAERESQNESRAAAEILSATHTNSSGFGTNRTISAGSETGHGAQTGANASTSDRETGSTSQGTEARSSTGQSQRVHNSRTVGAEKINSVSGGMSVGTGGKEGLVGNALDRPVNAQGAKGTNANGNGAGQNDQPQSKISRALKSLPNINGSVSMTGNHRDALNRTTDQTRSIDNSNAQTEGSRNEHAHAESNEVTNGSYDRAGVFTRNSTDQTSSVSQQDALSQAYTHEKRAQELHELSQSLTNDANFAESHSLRMSENLSQELAQWYQREANTKTGLNAPGLHETVLTDQQRNTRDGMISTFLAQKRQDVYNQVASRLHEPELVSVGKPSVGSEDDVRAKYHPHGLSALPAGPSLPDGSDIRAKVAAGGSSLDAEQASHAAIRAGTVVAGADVQAEVNKDMNLQFFKDPKKKP